MLTCIYILWVILFVAVLLSFIVTIIIIFTAAPVAYGSSWARGRSGAAAASLHHN